MLYDSGNELDSADRSEYRQSLLTARRPDDDVVTGITFDRRR